MDLRFFLVPLVSYNTMGLSSMSMGLPRGIPFFLKKKKKRETLKPSRNNIHCQPQARTQEKFFLMLSF